MNQGIPIGEDDLSALLDGALEDARAREVMAAVDADPALAARLAAFRHDKAMLKQVYGHVAEAPLPPSWIRMAGAPPASTLVLGSLPWRGIAALAACLIVAVIGGTLYLKQNPPQMREIVAAALAARDGAVHGEDVSGAVAGAVNQAASQAVQLKIKVPDLKPMGYSLAAMHVYGGPQSATEMVYRDRQGRRFSLYVRRSDGKPRFDQFEQAGLRICVWQDEEIGTVMSGDVSTATMQRLASLAYTGLTL